MEKSICFLSLGTSNLDGLSQRECQLILLSVAKNAMKFGIYLQHEKQLQVKHAWHFANDGNQQQTLQVTCKEEIRGEKTLLSVKVQSYKLGTLYFQGQELT